MGKKIKIYLIFILFIILIINIVSASKNLLEDSSFELGPGHGWGIGNLKSAPLFSQLDNKYSSHGDFSIKLPMFSTDTSQVLISKIYRLKPNTYYTLSFYARSDYSYSEIAASHVNSYEAEFGPGDSGSSPFFLAPSTWTRFSYTFKTTNNINKSTYYFTIVPHSQGTTNQYIWVDAVQLEEGSFMTTYSPRNTVEIGFINDSTKPGNVFFEDEPVIINMKAYNYGLTQNNVNVNYEIYDYFNNLVKSGIYPLILNANSSIIQQVDFSLSQNKRGSFRIIAWVDKVESTREEIIISVLPRPKVMNKNEASIFGSHVPFQDYWLSIMQKAGIKWDRTLSTGRQFRWVENEPTQGNFIWHDSEIDKSSIYGMSILGVIGSELYHVPDWAKRDADGKPNLVYWDNFVYQMVNHYKGKVNYWEVWNEPDTEGGRSVLTNQNVLTAEEYGQILKTAYLAIKRADPNATVVGMAAYYHYFVNDTFNSIGNNYTDIVSTHRYPQIDLTHLNQFLSVIKEHGNKDIWNSESGLKTDSYHQTLLSQDLWISYAQPEQRQYNTRVEIQVQNFAESIGNGMKKYFYYDARNNEAPNFLVTYSLFEYDGSLSPMAVSLSVLANLFEGSQGQGEAILQQDVTSYAFLRGSTPLLIIWSKKTNESEILQTTLNSSQVKFYNVMGNEIPIGTGVSITRSPIYVEGQGITLNQLKTSISISKVKDSTAPAISLVLFPTENVSGENVFLKWFGFDDVSLSTPNGLTGESILYSYRIIGHNNSWSNFGYSNFLILNLSDGIYTFELKARDISGNEASPINRSFAIGAFSPPSQPPRSLTNQYHPADTDLIKYKLSSSEVSAYVYLYFNTSTVTLNNVLYSIALLQKGGNYTIIGDTNCNATPWTCWK